MTTKTEAMEAMEMWCDDQGALPEFHQALDKVLAEERRATVERIRADIHEYMEQADAHGGAFFQIDRDDLDVILDEEAAR